MILAPLFVQVLLTFALLLLAGGPARRRAARAARSGRARSRLREPNWPKRALQVDNPISNQFELPVLFYVLTILAIITRQADLLFVLLAWVFVLCAARARLRPRHQQQSRACAAAFFGVGALVLAIMWVDLHRPHPARAAMTPGARLSAAIEVLADIEARRRPAADALKDWGLSHRFAGSGDRAAIAGLVYDALRRRASSAWLMGEATPRAVAARHAQARARARRRRDRAACRRRALRAARR